MGSGSAASRVPLSDALQLRDEWDALLDVTSGASPFMSWAWHRAWADAAPPDQVRGSEAVIVTGSGRRLQAVLPLAVRRMTFRRAEISALTWAIGDLACPDHLDLPASPDADIDAMLPAIEALPWHAIVLGNVAEGAANLTRLADGLAHRGHHVRWYPGWNCPYLTLPGSWNDHLATLTRSRRQGLRWQERRVVRDHGAVLTEYGADRWQEGWRHLTRLHDKRWNGSGALGHSNLDRLHEGFAREWARRGEVWLTTLDLGGEPAAAWYGFADAGTVYFYQTGRDPRWERESVGTVLIGLMLQRAIERGYRRFDFLRGDDPYKLAWTATRRTTRQLVVFRRGGRGAWLRCLDWAARARDRFAARGRAATEP